MPDEHAAERPRARAMPEATDTWSLPPRESLERLSPLKHLRTLVMQEATGEWVCAGTRVEVHVFLQSGRVAWATSSAAEIGFTKHLLEATDIDPTSIREVVRACRRERRPFGETLVEWGLATEAEVRNALQAQIRDSLATLPADGETVFLRQGREYQGYDRKLTFAFDQVWKQRRRHPSSVRRRPEDEIAPPLASEARPIEEPELPADARTQLLQSLLDAEAQVEWCALTEAGELLTLPAEHSLRPELPCTSLDASLLALRGDRQQVVALCATGTTAWCGAAPGALLGALLPKLRRHLNIPQPPPAVEPRSLRSAPVGVASEFVGELFRRPEVWAVYGVDHQGRPRTLGSRLEGDGGETAAALDLVIESHRDVLSAEDSRITAAATMASGSWFGGNVVDPELRSIWLVLDSREPQGMGWALLASVLRPTHAIL